MASYQIYTICSGEVIAGAEIGRLTLKGAGIEIPAILVGEAGRGRELGVLPIGGQLPMVPCPDRGKDVWTSRDKCEKCRTPLGESDGSCRTHPDRGEVVGRLLFAEVGKTKAGKPKLLARQSADSSALAIVVLRTKIGFRGGNSHTGDRRGWRCSKYGCAARGEGAAPDACPECGAGGWDGGPKNDFGPFPGEILAEGMIAQGDAGRMGNGRQLVAVVPKGIVFRTSYSGRLYGNPSAHYYVFTGEKILGGLTWDERCASDVF
ncbi:MAG: hypothetical protein WC114_12165 [Smithellaceae bacterium]